MLALVGAPPSSAAPPQSGSGTGSITRIAEISSRDAGGNRIATASADGTARIWDLVPEHAIGVLCGLLDRDSLADEWRALGPDRGDPPTCPN